MAGDADVIVVGAGLAGLVAATEIADAGKRVIVVDQEGEQSLGGQAFWSFGGLFLVDSPEQRRLGIRDSADLALQDWLGSAGGCARARAPRPGGTGAPRRASPAASTPGTAKISGPANGPRRTSTSRRLRSGPG